MVARARWGTLTVIATNEAVAILSFELTIYVLFALFEGNVHVSAGAHTAKVRTRVSCAVVVVTFLERPKCGSLRASFQDRGKKADFQPIYLCNATCV